MWKKTLFPLSVTFLLISVSCIFQNDPLAPNKPPEIVSFFPKARDLLVIAPDTCVFAVNAKDPDGDYLVFNYYVNDSLVSTDDTLIYYACDSGEYRVKCKVMDNSSYVENEWNLRVQLKENKPPEITWYFPEESKFSAAVGDTLEFYIIARDDDPASLEYMFIADSLVVLKGSQELFYRFLNRGDFLVKGIVWDGQYGDTVSWQVTIYGFPDTIPPSAITDLSGGPGDSYGKIKLWWTAPGDDSTYGRASSYILRTSTHPILTEDDWVGANGQLGEPVPSPAGSIDSMEVKNLLPGTYVYVTMRAKDDFYNLSPIGNCIKVLIRGFDVGGVITNAFDATPIENIYVRFGQNSDTTDALGRFLVVNLPVYQTSISIKDEYNSDHVGKYYDYTAPFTFKGQYTRYDAILVPYFDLVNHEGEYDPYQSQFYYFFKEITGTSGDLGKPTIWKNWDHWPITVYNPPMTYKGVDLQAYAREGMEDWETATGLDLFIETEDSLNADAVIVYDSVTVGWRHHVETPEVKEDGTPKRRVMYIYFKDEEIPVDLLPHLVYAHEFGHIIGLGHSRDIGHLMLGGTKPFVDHVTTDEANVVRIIYHLPSVMDFKYIIND